MKPWLAPLVFVLVSGLALALGWLWQRRLGRRARDRRRRLQEIASDRRRASVEPEGAGVHLAAHRLHRWMHRHAPGYVQLERLLARAHSEAAPLNVLATCAALGVGALVVCLSLALPPVLLPPLTLGVASLPLGLLLHRARRRRQRFEALLPEALDYLARALRAGHGLSVAMGMAAAELPAPVGQEFKVVCDEVAYGLGLDEALSGLAQRIHSPDLDFLVVALLIQRETGGNLTELMSGLSRTIRERMKLMGKVRTLSAEGRFSGLLLGSLPFVLGLVLSALNPGYMAVLWQTEQGQRMLTVGAVLWVLGFAALSRITRIRV